MNQKQKVLTILFALLFLLMALLVKCDALVLFDKTIYTFLIQFQSDYLTSFLRFITHFGDALYIFIITIFVVIINHRLGILCFINMLGNTLLNNLLKIMFVRVRPNILRLISIGGYSFPSGHAMMVMAFYGFLVYVIYHCSIKVSLKRLLCFLLVTLIVLVGISRIYLGVHFASDVIAGYLVSLFYLQFIIQIAKRKHIIA